MSKTAKLIGRSALAGRATAITAAMFIAAGATTAWAEDVSFEHTYTNVLSVQGIGNQAIVTWAIQGIPYTQSETVDLRGTDSPDQPFDVNNPATWANPGAPGGNAPTYTFKGMWNCTPLVVSGTFNAHGGEGGNSSDAYLPTDGDGPAGGAGGRGAMLRFVGIIVDTTGATFDVSGGGGGRGGRGADGLYGDWHPTNGQPTCCQAWNPLWCFAEYVATTGGAGGRGGDAGVVVIHGREVRKGGINVTANGGAGARGGDGGEHHSSRFVPQDAGTTNGGCGGFRAMAGGAGGPGGRRGGLVVALAPGGSSTGTYTLSAVPGDGGDGGLGGSTTPDIIMDPRHWLVRGIPGDAGNGGGSGGTFHFAGAGSSYTENDPNTAADGIVGDAGPAGMALSLCAQDCNMDVIDAENEGLILRGQDGNPGAAGVGGTANFLTGTTTWTMMPRPCAPIEEF